MKKLYRSAAPVGIGMLIIGASGCAGSSSDGGKATTTAAETTTPAASDGSTTTAASDISTPSTEVAAADAVEDADTPDVTAPTPTGERATSSDAKCAAFGAYLEAEVSSRSVTLEDKAQPGVPCNYTSADFERSILEVIPRKANGNPQQKDFELVCDDVAEGRGDAPQSSYVKQRARHMTSKNLTVATSDGEDQVTFLLGQVIDKSGRPSDLFAISCDADNVYQGRLRMGHVGPDVKVNPQLLINAAAAGING